MKKYYIYLLVLLLCACTHINDEKSKKEIEKSIQENLNKTISETFLNLKLGMNKEEVLKQLYSLSKDTNFKIQFNTRIDYFTEKRYDYTPFLYKLDSTISFSTSFYIEKDSLTINEYSLDCNLQFYENMLYSIHLSAFPIPEKDSSLFYNYFQKKYGIGHIDRLEFFDISNWSSWIGRSSCHNGFVTSDDNLHHYLKNWVFQNIEIFFINSVLEQNDYIVDNEYFKIIDKIASCRGFYSTGDEYQKFILKELENSSSMKFEKTTNLSKINIIYLDRQIDKKIYDDQREKAILESDKNKRDQQIKDSIIYENKLQKIKNQKI